MADKSNLPEKPKKKRGAASHRTRMQREADMAEVAKLMRRGMSLTQIAKTMNRSVGGVQKDWAKLLTRIHADQEADTQAGVALMKAQIKEVQVEAWAAYERSKVEFEKVIEEESNGMGPMSGGRTKTTRITENRGPGSEWLSLVMKCIQEINDLNGYYPKQSIDVNTNVFNWDIFADEDEIVEDVIEAEILKVSGPQPSQLEHVQLPTGKVEVSYVQEEKQG